MKKKDYPLAATITSGVPRVGATLTVENPRPRRRWRKKLKSAFIWFIETVVKQLIVEVLKFILGYCRTNLRYGQKAV